MFTRTGNLLRSAARGRSSRIRRVVGAMVVVPMLGVALLSGAQPAAAAVPLGTTMDSGYACNYSAGRQVSAHPPYMNSSTLSFENVAWQPVLQRWNGSVWVDRSNNALWRGDVQGQWMKAAAGPTGVALTPGWTNMYRGGMVAAFTFNYLEPGYYRVVNYFYRYRQAALSSTISWHRAGGGYCTLA